MLRSAAASSWQLPGREVLMEKATRRGQPRMGQQDFTYRVGGLGPAKNAEGIAYLRTRMYVMTDVFPGFNLSLAA
jgi:hypothetical protein